MPKAVSLTSNSVAIRVGRMLQPSAAPALAKRSVSLSGFQRNLLKGSTATASFKRNVPSRDSGNARPLKSHAAFQQQRSNLPAPPPFSHTFFQPWAMGRVTLRAQYDVDPAKGSHRQSRECRAPISARSAARDHSELHLDLRFASGRSTPSSAAAASQLRPQLSAVGHVLAAAIVCGCNSSQHEGCHIRPPRTPAHFNPRGPRRHRSTWSIRRQS